MRVVEWAGKSGDGKDPCATAVKRAEVGGKLIIRLHERAGKNATASVAMPMLGINSKVELSPWQIKTVSVGASERKVREVREVSLLET